MFGAPWGIRNKLLCGLCLLLAIVATLAWSGFQGLYDYRGLLDDLARVGELSTATELNQKISDLRVAALSLAHDVTDPAAGADRPSVGMPLVKAEFRDKLQAFRDALAKYEKQLDEHRAHTPIGDARGERQKLREIDDCLVRIDALDCHNPQAVACDYEGLNDELRSLQISVKKLPSFLHDSINALPEQVRGQYRRRITLMWITNLATALMLAAFVFVTYRWVLRPLRMLVKGARKVARGNYAYRIPLTTRDELSNLAAAMNDMTARFQTIHDDLDNQVQQRTREVIRAQQLASVGFLAANVANEINAPLAAVSESAEMLLAQASASHGGDQRRQAMLHELAKIQEQAFRCKGITTGLLDFARRGPSERVPGDLYELTQQTVDMIGILGAYQGKQVRLQAPIGHVTASVDPQEFKQVVLNLVTHGLDNVGPGGTVSIELRRDQEGVEIDGVEIFVADDGPAMTPEERRLAFEPCFNERGKQQGMGFGLFISERIVHEHGGTIEVSPGEVSPSEVTLGEVTLGSQFQHVKREGGRGNEFRIWLPGLASEQRASSPRFSPGRSADHRHQAA